MRRHEASVPIPVADGEILVDVSYDFHAGDPATPDPAAEPDGVEVLFCSLHGEAAPAWLVDLARDFIDGWLLDHHQEKGPDPDRPYDARRNGDTPSLLERFLQM